MWVCIYKRRRLIKTTSASTLFLLMFHSCQLLLYWLLGFYPIITFLVVHIFVTSLAWSNVERQKRPSADSRTKCRETEQKTSFVTFRNWQLSSVDVGRCAVKRSFVKRRCLNRRRYQLSSFMDIFLIRNRIYSAFLYCDRNWFSGLPHHAMRFPNHSVLLVRPRAVFRIIGYTSLLVLVRCRRLKI